MTIQEAEQLVNNYSSVLSAGRGTTARRLSELPASVARIKYAYFVFVEALIYNQMLTPKIGKDLTSTYGFLTHFVDDRHAEIINQQDEQPGAEFSGIRTAFTKRMSGMEGMIELNEFIQECLGRPRQNSSMYLNFI